MEINGKKKNDTPLPVHNLVKVKVRTWGTALDWVTWAEQLW